MQERNEIVTCEICDRPLVEGPTINEHHLIPKTYKGRDTITIHVICHSKIHSVFSEKELYEYYHTPERLRSHPEIMKFIKWVSKKDPLYRDRNRLTKARRASKR